MDRLKRYLEANGTSQKAFADELGVSQPTVSDWLSGKVQPRGARLKLISEKTGISIDELLAASPTPESPPAAA